MDITTPGRGAGLNMWPLVAALDNAGEIVTKAPGPTASRATTLIFV